MFYDLVIIGAGPSGLALATYCSKLNKKILIIDKEAEVGGCHRVRRVKENNENIFTEHGPRIYSSSYKNFINLLKGMDEDFYKLFTPYHFTMSAIGGETVWSTLTMKELFNLFIEYTYLILNDSHGNNMSMKEFTSKKKFQIKSIDMIDKICRLTDGADINRYTLNQFLHLFNQQVLYGIYQPKHPNDIGLFTTWRKYLANHNVTFQLSSHVDKIILDESNSRIQAIQIQTPYKKIQKINANTFVAAVPPLNLVQLLKNSNNLNAFGNLLKLDDWSKKTAYIDYISITFHWNKKIDLPSRYGFPKTDWGVAYIVLTDYMNFNESSSKTVISTAVTITNRKSSHINKTADECSKYELIQEVYRQLLLSYPDLPLPTLSILSPGVDYDNTNKKWVSYDTAFISTSTEGIIPFKSDTLKNFYNLGTHNGKSKYKFTSLEAAVSNALELSYILYPETRYMYNFDYGYTVRDIVLLMIIIMIIVIAFYCCQ
jgi:uncharacterized protein with NAD-binding domain and iron-sulfur cluster